MRRCKQCKTEIASAAKSTTFIGKKGFCSVDCAAEWGQKAATTKRERDYRKSNTEARDRLKTRSEWITEAQKAFNAYIRARDFYRGCISCGTTTAGQYHAGHYRTTKACPELRFYTLQVFKQCAQCNAQLSGNIIAYRKALVELLGYKKVEWVEGPHESKKYTIDDLKRIKRIFNKKTKMRQRQ